MSRRAAATLLAVCLLPALLPAQQLKLAPMTARYTVNGEFQGNPMPPWEAELSVRDTILTGKKYLVVTRTTLRPAMDASFSQTAVIDTAGGRVVALSGWNRGQQVGNHFRFELAGGRITGRDEETESGTVTINSTLAENAVPEFALATVLAGRPLVDSAVIAVPVFTYANGMVRIYPFKGKVSTGTFPRAGAAGPVPVWIVTGDAGYAAHVVIARGDAVPLQVRIPQGSVGSQTDLWAVSRP